MTYRDRQRTRKHKKPYFKRLNTRDANRSDPFRCRYPQSRPDGDGICVRCANAVA